MYICLKVCSDEWICISSPRAAHRPLAFPGHATAPDAPLFTHSALAWRPCRSSWPWASATASSCRNTRRDLRLVEDSRSDVLIMHIPMDAYSIHDIPY